MAEVHGNRGVALAAAGRLGEAEWRTAAPSHSSRTLPTPTTISASCCASAAPTPTPKRRCGGPPTLKPNWPQCRLNLAVAFKSQGKFLEAEAAILHVVTLDPNNADAFSTLGDVLWCLGRLADAENVLRHAVALRPRFADAFARLGNVLREQGKFDEAEAAGRQALALDADHAGAHSHLGNVLTERGDLGAAEAAYRRAIALKPNFAEAYNNLGAILKQQSAAWPRLAKSSNRPPVWCRRARCIISISAKSAALRVDDPYLAEMEELYRTVGSLPVKQQIELNFALAKAYDDVGRFDVAFERLAAGNALRRGQSSTTKPRRCNCSNGYV